MDETSGAADRLQFGVLGPLQVTRAGAPVSLGGPQQRAVLALLLVEAGTVVSLGRIADALWGERVPAGFAATVQTYVFHLREVLEPRRGRGAPGQVLVTEPGGYRLQAGDGAVDAASFEQMVHAGQADLGRGEFAEGAATLTDALGLWRGEVLADLPDFEFVAPFAARLDELRLAAIASRIEADLALGRHAVLLGDLDELVARYSLDERLHAARILALYRAGRQSDALDGYRALRTVLHDELGVEPSPQLQQLHRAVLAHDPKLDWQAPLPSSDGRRPGAAGAQPSEPSGGGAAVRARPARRRRWWVLGACLAAAVAVVGSVSALVVSHQHHASLRSLPANSVGAIHADGSLHDAVPVGPNPSAVAYGAGTLWVTSSTDGQVARIDTRTHRVVQTFQVGRAPDAIVVTDEDAWVANAGDGTVSRINANTNTVADTIPVGALPVAIGAGPSGVWVANSGDDSIQRLDAVTGAADRPIAVGGRPAGIAVGEHAVWVANSQDGSVTEIEPRSGQNVSGPIAVGAGPGALAVTGDAVWVANTDEQSVERLDPRSGTVRARVLVGDGPSSLAVARGGRVWLGNAYDGTVSEIDPSTDKVRHRFGIGASPRAMVAVGASVWVASGAFADTAHMGGTLTVAGPLVPGGKVGIDPASAYVQTTTLRALRLVYDGLVSYHVAGGSAGLTIVPDLATAVPRPSDGGRTYSFTLRRGVRFSDGTPVRASDIQRGVLRSLTISPGGWASTVGIVGAERCGQPRTRCDLSRGVIVNNATDSIVFHLNAPDPEFLFKLPNFGQATVPGAPATESKTPLPGTGPYQISQYRQGKVFVLTRNPYFTQWSFATQPAGYPDTIRWAKTPDGATAVANVLAGRADLVRLPGSRSDAVSQATTNMIRKQHPGQFKVENPFQVDWMYLNTTVAPFNDFRVRQAINYAVDRRKIVDIYGGAARAVPTCQMLPPDFPGYQPYCPYSTGPPDALYDGPNLVKAHTLAAASRTRGMVVTVTGTNDAVSHAANSYLLEILHSLGYRTHLQELTDDTYHALLKNPKARWQILQGTGWLADYPTASDFYLNLFSCRPAALENGVFAARPCNRDLDALAEQAYHAEGNDPGSARADWAAIDRQLTNQATIVALDNQLEATVVSQRVGNYQSSPELGPLLSQIWVQ